MTQEDLRPDPEAMLAQTREKTLGKLRIFLGMAPGVGKTYAMLAEAHQRKNAGLDVLIGWVTRTSARTRRPSRGAWRFSRENASNTTGFPLKRSTSTKFCVGTRRSS